MKRAVAVLAGVWLLAGPAMAQIDSREGIALQNQILELRRQIQLLPRGGGGGSAPADRTAGDGGLTGQLLDRVGTLEEQVRDLRGQVETLSHQLQTQAADFSKQLGDLQFAMQNNGRPNPSYSTSGPPPLVPPPSVLGSAANPPPPFPTAPTPRTPEIALQEANAALARRDYAAAAAAAREVLAKKGPRSTDAQYVLAEAEMGQHNYQQAAPDFYDAYNRARTGTRAADSLLGVANALNGLGDKPAACQALAKLRAEFPQPRPEIREGEAAIRQSAGCR